MPRRCSVAGCRSNYDTESEHVTTFSLPKDETLCSLWLSKIPNDFSKLKNPIVCIKHFPESSIIKVDRVMVNGEMKEYERKIPKYIENAVPCLFPNLPYLNKPKSKVCQLAKTEEEKNLNTAVMQCFVDYKKYIEESAINCIDDISRHVTNFKEKKECWAILKKGEKLAVCCMNTDGECPSVSACLLVEQNLEFTVYLNNVKINENKLPHRGKILNKQKLEDLLTWIEASKSGDENSLLDTIISLIKSIPNYKESEDLQFIVEQIKLSF